MPVLWWIWSLLGPDAEMDLYPEITAAWVEGLANLAQKGIKPTDLPLVSKQSPFTETAKKGCGFFRLGCDH